MDLSIATTNLLVTGETVFGKDFRMIPGGKGANQAIIPKIPEVKKIIKKEGLNIELS